MNYYRRLNLDSKEIQKIFNKFVLRSLRDSRKKLDEIRLSRGDVKDYFDPWHPELGIVWKKNI